MMASRQRTFDLIPTSLARSNGQKPPMTSKAAKKAHQLATRGPKVSRAEQRRRDAEELAQQKKEFEREKAAAKAKAVREKKAAKEQADRELRKKNGIPEPSRFEQVNPPYPDSCRQVTNAYGWTWIRMRRNRIQRP
jgi:phage-related minor tail protein